MTQKQLLQTMHSASIVLDIFADNSRDANSTDDAAAYSAQAMFAARLYALLNSRPNLRREIVAEITRVERCVARDAALQRLHASKAKQ